MATDYLSILYDPKAKPVTDYPAKLTAYLVGRFKLPANGKLLEIGCGRGDFLEEFHKAGFQAYGVDLEKKSADILPHLEIKQNDISKDRLPYEDNTFDVVFHKSLIEHLTDPGNLMSETFRVLKKGGKIVILTPDWEKQMCNFFDDYTHKRPYTVESLKGILGVSGFKGVRSEIFFQLPAVWKQPALSFLSKLIRPFVPVKLARWMTKVSGIKYFRWSVESMILGYGEKE